MKKLLSLLTALCALGAPTLCHSQMLSNQPYLSLTQQSAWLLTDQRIQRQLKLSPDQSKTIAATNDQYGMDNQKLWKSSKPTAEQFQEIAKRYSSILLTPLTPEQSERLHQIALQLKGPAALLEPNVSKSLGLNARQEGQIHALFDAADKRQREFGEQLAEEIESLPELSDKNAMRASRQAAFRASRAEQGRLDALREADGQKALTLF